MKVAIKKNEKGSIILIALFVMFAITALGIMASKSTVVETKIAANQKKIDEEFANAEAALNLAVRTFSNLPTTPTVSNGEGKKPTPGYSINNLLNDNQYPDPTTAVYSADISALTFPGTDNPIARVEIRRIVQPAVTCPALSAQANNVPILPHTRYSGSIDRKRFAITITAYDKNSGNLSNTWVQKGVNLPIEQDSDIF